MKQIFNYMFYLLKFLLLIGAFGTTLFVMMRMNMRLDRNIVDSLHIFIPFIVLLVVFIINIIFKQNGVTNNLFYNLTCCLVFATVLFVGYRAIFDTNMVLNEKYGYGIDFNFFDNFIAYMNIMLYGLSIADIFFMFKEREKSKKIEA